MKVRYFLLVMLLFGVAACRSSRIHDPVKQVTKSVNLATEETFERVVDYSKADSAGMVATLSIDPAGRVTMQSILDYSPGENVTPEVRILDNYIYVKCRVDSAEVYRKYSKLFITSTDTSSRTTFIPAPGVSSTRCRDAGFFHRTLHTAGYFFLAELLILAGYLIFKFKKLVSIF